MPPSLIILYSKEMRKPSSSVCVSGEKGNVGETWAPSVQQRPKARPDGVPKSEPFTSDSRPCELSIGANSEEVVALSWSRVACLLEVYQMGDGRRPRPLPAPGSESEVTQE